MQYQRTSCSSRYRSILSLQCDCIAGERAMVKVSCWIVYRIPSNNIFKFTHARIPTYFLLSQSQHNTVPYIQSKFTSSPLSLNTAWAWHRGGVTTHRIPRNDTYIYIQTFNNTNVLPVSPTPTQRRSIYSIKISAEPYAIAMHCSVFEYQVSMQSRWCHRSWNQAIGAFKFRHAPIMTYCLVVKSQHDANPLIQSISISTHTIVSAIVFEWHACVFAIVWLCIV